jgi:hypothetical protein
MATRLRFLSGVLSAVLAFPLSAAAFDTPLSDTAVREAYFLGQRHDDTLTRFLDKYTKHLPPPKAGPYLSSISFFTPFALIAQQSSQRAGGYSAQQAQIDHRSRGESVRVVVQFECVDTSSGSPTSFTFRPRPFWNDYSVQVFDRDNLLTPFNSSVEPNYICSDEGGCTLTGATLSFEFSPESFTTDTASVRVTSPYGDPIHVELDLSALR